MAEPSPAAISQSSPPPLFPLPDGGAPDLDPALLAQAAALDEWLLSEAARLDDAGDVLSGLAERLDSLGVPVDRISTAIEALHSEYSGVGRLWTREGGRPCASSRTARRET
jgi:adenylate cyclase